MKTTIKCGPQVADDADLSGSSFHNVNLSNSQLNDVNLSGTKFHNINFSDISISAVQIGGATFKHVGLPDGASGKQRGLRFEQCDLNHSVFRACDLSGVQISECNIDGMKIDGVRVTELLLAYQETRRKSKRLKKPEAQ